MKVFFRHVKYIIEDSWWVIWHRHVKKDTEL